MPKKRKRSTRGDPFTKSQLLRILNGYCPYHATLVEMVATHEDAAEGPTQSCTRCSYIIHGMPLITGGS